jgi:hypothetical protein
MNPVAYGGNAVANAREQVFCFDAKTCGIRRVVGVMLGVNVNQTNTDIAIPLFLLPGSNFVLRGVQLNNASISLTTATAGVFTAAGGTGTTLVTSAALSSLTSSTVNLDMTLATQAVVLNQTTQANVLYFRVGTAQGAAATVDVYLWGDTLP